MIEFSNWKKKKKKNRRLGKDSIFSGEVRLQYIAKHRIIFIIKLIEQFTVSLEKKYIERVSETHQTRAIRHFDSPPQLARSTVIDFFPEIKKKRRKRGAVNDVYANTKAIFSPFPFFPSSFPFPCIDTKAKLTPLT